MMAPSDDTDTTPPHEEPSERPTGPPGRSRLAILLAVALLFVVLAGVRLADDARQSSPPAGGGASGEVPAEGPDPAVAYADALVAGRPIFVLFHSSTCAPCVEIETTAAEVLPAYADSVTFVDVYTDDPRAQPLYSEFAFQYIPTSFFLDSQGGVVDQHTGVLTAEELRERLDTLVASSTGG